MREVSGLSEVNGSRRHNPTGDSVSLPIFDPPKLGMFRRYSEASVSWSLAILRTKDCIWATAPVL